MQYKTAGGNAMVPHMSGTTLDAQARYAAGTKKILENYFEGKEQTPSDVICINGDYATKYPPLPTEANFQGLWTTQEVGFILSIYANFISVYLFKYCHLKSTLCRPLMIR